MRRPEVLRPRRIQGGASEQAHSVQCRPRSGWRRLEWAKLLARMSAVAVTLLKVVETDDDIAPRRTYCSLADHGPLLLLPLTARPGVTHDPACPSDSSDAKLPVSAHRRRATHPRSMAEPDLAACRGRYDS